MAERGDLLMLVWHSATTVRIHHLRLVENAYAVSLRFVASLNLVIPLASTSPTFGSAAGTAELLSLSDLGWPVGVIFSCVSVMLADILYVSVVTLARRPS